MIFWLAAALISLAVAVPIVLALLRGRAPMAPTAAYDLQVYREQLKDVARDEARGVIDTAEAERLRLEISRRVLAADRALARAGAGPAGAAPAPLSAALALGLVLALGGGTFALYTVVGAPGYGDLPLAERIAAARELRETRPSQAEAEAQIPPDGRPSEPADPRHADLIKQLRAVVAERPDDLQGMILLARNEAALGNFPAAHAAQARVIALKEGRATADDYAALADMLVVAAGGYVSPEAEAALREALAREARNGTAMYYWGLMQAQTGRPDIAFQAWRRLLQISEPDDPWLANIRAELPDLAWRAGVEYTLPPTPVPGGAPLRGPSAEDMANAAEMAPEDRQAMIRGMVAGLSDRLATNGGTAAEWAQLINALGVLGETEQARAIWGEAQQVFAATPEMLETVRAAARRAGVAE